MAPSTDTTHAAPLLADGYYVADRFARDFLAGVIAGPYRGWDGAHERRRDCNIAGDCVIARVENVRGQTRVYVMDEDGVADGYVVPKMPAPEAECLGHESLAGDHMGRSMFCDGSCQRAE